MAVTDRDVTDGFVTEGDTVQYTVESNGWGRTPGGGLDQEAADEVLARLGYTRAEPWGTVPGGWAATVENVD
ncbi:MAG: hypothetical protein ACRDSK_13725 [Actinophytocola sp.]|uniref:hypothetical protein n=1 Tax=Actinophytocola sp. TaxID=1872138 RepID=UPI003D6B5200